MLLTHHNTVGQNKHADYLPILRALTSSGAKNVTFVWTVTSGHMVSEVNKKYECAQFHGNLISICPHTLIWTRVLDRQTDVSIMRPCCCCRGTRSNKRERKNKDANDGFNHFASIVPGTFIYFCGFKKERTDLDNLQADGGL